MPPMGSSPISVPGGSPGANADALSSVGEALNMLNKALPNLPIGSDVYKAISSAISGISKYAPPSGAPAGVQQSQLRGLIANAGRNAMLQQVMGSLGGAGGAAQQQGAGAGGAAPGPALPTGG
jgi:hypothetical protein